MGYQKWSDADLSAYLDGQLSPDQARALESALQDNQELKARLDGLNAVASLMRELPAYEAPRNYILTPSMVEANSKQPVRRYRAPLFMRVATSLTAAAFIVTMGLNVFLNSSASMPFAMMSEAVEETYAEPEMMMFADEPADAEPQAPRAFEMEEEETVEKAVVVEKTIEVETESIVETEDGVGENGELPNEMGIGGGGEEPELGAATLLPEDGEGQVEESITEEAEEADAVNTVEMEETAVDDAGVGEASIEPTAMPLPTATLQVVEELPQPSPEEMPAPPTWGTPQQRFPQWLPWTLGGCALVLGLVTWFMGRRRR